MNKFIKQNHARHPRPKKDFIFRLKYTLGSAYLSGFFCVYHIEVPGSNPKNTNFNFYCQILYYICHCIEKRTKTNKKAGFGPYFKKCTPPLLLLAQHQHTAKYERSFIR